jgi:hypothetical protein
MELLGLPGHARLERGDRLHQGAVRGLQLGPAPEHRVERLPGIGCRLRLERPSREDLELLAGKRLEQRVLGREVPVDGADADLGAARDVLEVRLAALGREHGPGRLEHALAIAARVSPQGPLELLCADRHVHNCRG